MKEIFKPFRLGNLELANRFVFPPIKLGYGNPEGRVTEQQLLFYRETARNGPGIVILEPVAVTPDGREHPRQLSICFPYSVSELSRIVEVIHHENRRVCLHVNHAGGAANPKATGCRPKAPSVMTCPTTGQESEALTGEEIDEILSAYRSAAEKAVDAGFDMIEIQAGHGYLVSQFLNRKINQREDAYGRDRLLFAKRVFQKVREGAPGLPLLLRISGSEMSAEFGLEQEALINLMEEAKKAGISAVHVGMGNSCFSPPWYFHHASLPDQPQMDALAWVRQHTPLPVIAVGRMGRKRKIMETLGNNLADMIALGRPLIADPDLIQKWSQGKEGQIIYCGYCLQGCLHRLKNGKPLGCNLNPEIAQPPLAPTNNPLRVLVVGGGPAGLSAALYMSRGGHDVRLVEKKAYLGGQFALAWKCPGKSDMKEGLDSLERAVRNQGIPVILNRTADPPLIREMNPDLLVWAAGAQENIPEIPGLEKEYAITSIQYLEGEKEIRGPRVLVIGAGRVGLEIAEKLGGEGFQVVATKRTDPIGSMMEMITRKLALMRLARMDNVSIMPHTTVKAFLPDWVEIEQDGEVRTLEPFQTVILAAGMVSAGGPDHQIRKAVPKIEVIGDANEVSDIFSAVRSGYDLAKKYTNSTHSDQ